ncbi:hypothetical protein BKA65DRAFT_574810 [Rhexocercosporidium sp. MPI-PUGE-AT-0058]|nr:hypothetical protein BKA65DRAFT_574810 [Rhexocercosporidium sp. MPI-PUGE-AT-0058]
MSHTTISPAIFYWGTPVVLVTTQNEDGTPNTGPISSAFWLGNRCMLGLEANSQTTINLLRTKECVLNLPTDDMVPQVNALAHTTGSLPIPDIKITPGYWYKDKFTTANLTPQLSDLISPPRILECAAQIEYNLVGQHKIISDLSGPVKGFTIAIKLKVLRTHVVDSLRLKGYENRIDPDHLQGLEKKKVESTLAEIKEELYRLPDN